MEHPFSSDREEIIILKQAGQNYLVMNGEFKGNPSNQRLTLECKNAQGQECKFQIKAHGLFEAFDGLIEEERLSGRKHWLMIDLDKPEWLVYPMAEEIERKYFSI